MIWPGLFFLPKGPVDDLPCRTWKGFEKKDTQNIIIINVPSLTSVSVARWSHACCLHSLLVGRVEYAASNLVIHTRPARISSICCSTSDTR